MTLGDLGNLLQLLNDMVEVLGILEVETDIGTGLVTDGLGRHDEHGAIEDSLAGELLNALVDGGTTDATGTGHLEERHAGILANHAQNESV